MFKRTEKNLVVGLDIGTTKVVVLVGELLDNQGIEVIGVGSHPSCGLKRGVVVNIERTVQSIRKAVEAAELMVGCRIHSAFTGIAGAHISSLNSHGIVAIRDREVGEFDVERVIDTAKAVAIPADQKILHVLPQEFIVDHQRAIREPIGMAGIRLEVRVHIVTGSTGTAQNIVKCVEHCDLQVGDIILEQLASSYAVLTEDEKELGVCMIDIGGGTTDIAIFIDGAIQHTSVIPIAGDQVTHDIAIALRTPMKSAEQIKKEHAYAISRMIEEGEMIDVPGIGPHASRQLSKKKLSEIVEARYEELFNLIYLEIERTGFKEKLAAGVVLTGGASLVESGVELAEIILNMPVRLGAARGVSGPQEVIGNPIYATGVGLLIAACKQGSDFGMSALQSPDEVSMWRRMRRWFKGNF